MQVIHKIADTKKVAELFKDWDETMIWSCLQGVMGEIYVAEKKEKSEYKSAVAILGAFAFFAGEPNVFEAEWLRRIVEGFSGSGGKAGLSLQSYLYSL